MKCSFCQSKVTKDQLRGKLGKRCVKCTPKGVLPDKAAPKEAKAPKKAAPKKAAPKKAAKPTSDYPATITALNSMLKKDLVALAEELGSSTKGLKDDLVKRLAKKLKIK